MSIVTDIGAKPLTKKETDLYQTNSGKSEFTFLLARYEILTTIANDLRNHSLKHVSLRKKIINQKIHVDVRIANKPTLPEGDLIKSFYPDKYQGRKFRKQSKNHLVDISSDNIENWTAKVRPESIPFIMQREDAHGPQRIRALDLSLSYVGEEFNQTAIRRDAYYASATLNACHIVGTDIWKTLIKEVVEPEKIARIYEADRKKYVDESTAMCFLGRQKLHTWLSSKEKEAKLTLKNDLQKKIAPDQALRNAIDIVYSRPSMAPLKTVAYNIIDVVLGEKKVKK